MADRAKTNDRCARCGSLMGQGAHICISPVRYDEHRAARESCKRLDAALQKAYRELSNVSREHDDAHNWRWLNEAMTTLREAVRDA